MSIYLVECKGALLNSRIVSINEDDKDKYVHILRMSRYSFDELSDPRSRPINTTFILVIINLKEILI